MAYQIRKDGTVKISWGYTVDANSTEINRAINDFESEIAENKKYINEVKRTNVDGKKDNIIEHYQSIIDQRKEMRSDLLDALNEVENKSSSSSSSRGIGSTKDSPSGKN